MTGNALRLDKFLFFARVTRTRALAQKIIGDGHVRMDGHVVTRAHAPVSVGAVITLPVHGEVRVLKVLALPARRGPPPEARRCYSDPRLPDMIDGTAMGI